MSTDLVWQVLTGVVVTAIMFVLVRPGSRAAGAIKDIGDALTAMVETVAGTAIS